jgi:hypothetical protein
MKKRVLMSLVVFAIIGTSAVFAQEPTLDKVRSEKVSSGYRVRAANKNISGTVVIPAVIDGITMNRIDEFRGCTGITEVIILNGLSVIDSTSFQDCTGLKSITIPASVTDIGATAFRNCTNLTSVTFQGSTTKINDAYGKSNPTFPGDLIAKYMAGGAGTYTRSAGSDTWTKQGGFTLNGEWTRSDGMKITISGDGTQTFTITGNAPNNGGRFTRNFAER